ncbi:MAG TPA: ABC transporter ATP-binding protein [Pseudobacteroides sp.]|uniref:ABC transporter ATP-binding protein n=1 Tax=Pseudobacteroides sp. TaxID=1968840 RepID=UPI002F958C4A
MIIVNNLHKKYGQKTVVENISMSIESGKITLLLGPNGAGKSTTLKSIAGLLNFNGNINICGFDNKSLDAKRVFGYIPETPALYDLLNVEEHLRFIAKAYKLDDRAIDIAKNYMDRFELTEHITKPTRELSKGMQQKVSVCLALMTSPKAVMFDEPMVGLDPKAIKSMKEIIISLREKGTSVLISTHIIDIVDDIWDKAYIMNKGKIAACLTREEAMKSGKSLNDTFFEITEGGAGV